MSDAEEKELIELALDWRKRTCHTPDFVMEDCGDHDCMALRDAANSLLSVLNIQRIRRP